MLVLGEGGNLIFPIVQRTMFVKNVNNRLLYLGLVSGGGGSFPPKTLAVYFACCICNPLVVVAFFFFKGTSPPGKGRPGGGAKWRGRGGGRGRELQPVTRLTRKWGSLGRAHLPEDLGTA